MPKHEIRFEVKDQNQIELPAHLLRDGGSYSIEVRDGDLYVWGNRDGLLYIGEALVRLAIGGYTKTLHVHLPMDSSVAGDPIKSGESPALVLFAASEMPR